MANVTADYVIATPDCGWRIANTRVSLDSVVRAYQQGKTPEAIVDEFPTLSAEQVYGAIAFYLRNRQEIDLYLSRQNARWEQLAQQSEAANRPLLERIRARRNADSGKRPTP